MRPSALPGALASARSEALNAFGSAELILEKAIVRPRHVEFQVFADSHGNTLHVRRAGLLGAASSSEGGRGSTVSGAGRCAACAHGCGGGRGRAQHRLPRCRHGGVPARREWRVLFPRDEHPAAGRTPGDRDDHGARSGGAADSRRRGKGAGNHPGAGAVLGACDRGAALCRRPGQGFSPGQRPGGAVATGERRWRARRCGYRQRPADLAVLRSDDREDHCLGREPGYRNRAAWSAR